MYMSEREMEYRLNELQKELSATGEDMLENKRSFQAAIDTLKLEVRALWLCLDMLHSDQKDKICTLKEQVLKDVDPEHLSELCKE
jgi:hypothetical protein